MPKFLLCLLAAACVAGPGPVAERLPVPVVLEEDAGWCWFQDERAIVIAGDRVVFGSVASGWKDPSRAGTVQVTQWDPLRGAVTTAPLHERLEKDDHDAPALWQRPDGRLLAMYCRHGGDDLMRWRTSARPDDATEWQAEQVLRVGMQTGRGVTYANVLPMVGGPCSTPALLCLCRAENWKPTVLMSFSAVGEGDAGGAGSPDPSVPWAVANALFRGPGRPYAKYASDGQTIHLVVTEGHPRDSDNGLYHGVLPGFLRAVPSDWGTTERAADLSVTPAPEQLTRIFQGRADAVAWPCDLEIDPDGLPVCAFSVQVDGAGLPKGQGGMDHRYWLARFDGDRWHARQIAHAGTRLYRGEDDYTGLVAIVPDDPRTVFVSTNAHPVTGEPLISRTDGRRLWEIWRGFSALGGFAFEWTPVTRDSTEDNLRPIVPRWRKDRCALLWLRGEYRSYTDYRQAAVGLVMDLPR